MKRVTDLNNIDARAFFLKVESYFNSDLPQYFTFENLLKAVSTALSGKRLSDFYDRYTTTAGMESTAYPSDFEDVNYKFLNNKDGKFAWRPLQLIHPALYVSLVHAITETANWTLIVERFRVFSANPKIRCYSIPIQSEEHQSDKASTVTQWWQSIEQQSIELALKYEYVLHTDITDCYGSMYTHSLSWAIHTKPIAKLKDKRNNKSFIGVVADKHLQDMAYGQTNGIPQGSVLMDFLAEIVLGYADLELSERIQTENIQNYEIIRYRDDYRIFSNNPQVAEQITKILTEILIELGMRLNAQKTLVSNSVIKHSIKSDKLYWMSTKKGARSIQEHLLLIHKLSEEHPNSGSLTKALNKFYNRIVNMEETNQSIKVLVSILVDIMYKNPRVYPISAAILSKLLSLLSDISQRDEILQLIYQKFEKIPNTGHIKIWLQRLTIKFDRLRLYEEGLCKKVNESSIKIWNSDWLSISLRNLIDKTPIIDEQVISDIDIIIKREEVQLFRLEYDYDETNEE
jgi:RNA-directed DNA polymerase